MKTIKVEITGSNTCKEVNTKKAYIVKTVYTEVYISAIGMYSKFDLKPEKLIEVGDIHEAEMVSKNEVRILGGKQK